jgi:periplasmic protein TonB
MVPRLTSAKVTEAPTAQDAQRLPAQSSTVESGTGDNSQVAARDEGTGARPFRSEKVIAADIARDLVLQEIVQQARLTTTATGAFIAFARGHKVVAQATSGANAAEFVNGLNRHRRMIDACLGSGSVQICRDSETSEDLNASACRYLGARSVVILPILDEAEKTLGVFGAFSPQTDGFSNANIVALQSLSRRIADALAQLEKSIAGSARDAAAAMRSEPRALSGGTPVLRSSRRTFAAFSNPAVWGVGVLALVLLLSWTVSRAISRRTAATAASTPTATIPQVAPAEAPPSASQPDSSAPSLSAPAQASSAQPAPQHASSQVVSDNANAAPAKSPVAKPSATIAPRVANKIATTPKPTKPPTAKPKPSIQAAARPGSTVPDLEIENALDDASSGQTPSGQAPSVPAGTFRSPSQPRNVPVPGSIPPSSIAPSSAPSRTTAANSGAPPTPYNTPPASSPHEAVRITRDPGPVSAAASPAPLASAPAPSASANTPARPGGPVMIPEATALQRVVEKVKPDYPEEAMALNVQGTVVVDVVVGRTGLVENATPVDGDARLLASAVKAARKWQFAPLLRDNHFVSFETHLTLHFALP